MSALRIRCALGSAPEACEWAMDGAARASGGLEAAPQQATRVELVVPAADVTLARAQLPPGARRRADKVLAYAVEDETLGDPDDHLACWLGAAGPADVLAVMDRAALAQTLAALAGAGLEPHAVYCETLLLPRSAGEWSVFWNGRDGFVRTGDFEGGATDEGDAVTPPIALDLLLKEAAARGAAPSALALYVSEHDVVPDVAAWQAALALPVHYRGVWDWRTAAANPHARLALKQPSVRGAALARRLKPVAWIAVAALLVHVAALGVDWGVLASDQRALRKGMEARFREIFPEAVAVADPALQARRKLAETRHAAGIVDPDDFLPALARAAPAVLPLPAGSLRGVSYEAGLLTVHLSGLDEATLRAVIARLADAGVAVVRRSRTTADGSVALTLGGA